MVLLSIYIVFKRNYKDLWLEIRPENRSEAGRKAKQNIPKSTPKASPEKTEIAYKPPSQKHDKRN